MNTTDYFDVLHVPSNSLFCSYDCLLEEYPNANSAEMQEVRQEEHDTNHDEGVATGAQWGAICPGCENEYNCF